MPIKRIGNLTIYDNLTFAERAALNAARRDEGMAPGPPVPVMPPRAILARARGVTVRPVEGPGSPVTEASGSPPSASEAEQP